MVSILAYDKLDKYTFVGSIIAVNGNTFPMKMYVAFSSNEELDTSDSPLMVSIPPEDLLLKLKGVSIKEVKDKYNKNILRIKYSRYC